MVVLSPRPGRIRKVVEVDVPRPRTLGRNAHLADVARISADLHELLMERNAPDVPGQPGPVAGPGAAGPATPARAGTGGR